MELFSVCFRLFLFGGIFMVLLGVGNFVLFCHAYTLASVTGFKYSQRYAKQFFYDTAKQIELQILLSSFHLNGHAIRFHQQTQKLESPCTA